MWNARPEPVEIERLLAKGAVNPAHPAHRNFYPGRQGKPREFFKAVDKRQVVVWVSGTRPSERMA